MSAYRRTWAKWRERNAGNYDEAIRYARGGYLDRAPEIVGNGDCVNWQLSPGYYSVSPEAYAAYGPMLDRINKGWPVRTDEPVAIWETVTHTWADFKAAIERATHG